MSLQHSAGRRSAPGDLKGKETPRLFTKPLRKLTPKTSLGFDVIRFASVILGLELFPWQKWLLIHALELNKDGTYRFRKLCILVGRQNGKTTLLTVLCLYWLYVDSGAFPEHVKPRDFLILGTAQDLDTAQEAWDRTNAYCDPDPENEAGIPTLQSKTLKPVLGNGKTSIRLKSGAKYRVKAANRKGGRGKSAARVLMDELREQQNFDAWSSVTKTMNAIFNSQLWGISNAGDAKSVVLRHLRDIALESVNEWDKYVETGIQSVEEYANKNDLTLGLFEWSAPDGCKKDDPEAIAQANPSLGYTIEWETILSDLKTDPEFVFRTEVLCQWVTAAVFTYIDPLAWASQCDLESEIAPNSPVVIGVDTSADRSMTYVSVAGFREDGNRHVETVAQRAGMMWAPEAIKKIADKAGTTDVAVQAKGTPAIEFIEPLEKLGLNVIQVGGSELGSSAGQFKDHVEAGTVFHRSQPVLDMAISGGVTKTLGNMQVWDRIGSLVDVASVISANYALYGLDVHKEPATVSAYVAMGEEDNPDWW
ncbi:Putative phage terminase, large subunit [Arthrobacter sp. 9V]|nr:Putative phage terminase, large subunit [Arthrobacter sp. 9V]